ncbi:MAG TPA: molybdate ABC transporter substrate-binding protein [Actinophytocola sp.]|uniref:molybdate ABC transporter substrate-binding protein n=1 Tax=Actinophytocola sp. TaxID=1872138 RepID=UPI002DBAF886|nr:molybdate ABC transporter substrate-binding protein [Actinophytocola sp.]HEU5475603.1 molybdate ABC transporter substrate-binding protein [Actinophytocola sp.]
MSRSFRALALAAVAAGTLAGCGGTDTPAAPAGSGSTAPTVSGDITVFAAASLTEAFTRIGKDFEAANPGAKVTFNFAGSSALAQQINQGAPADVFASAAPTNMKQVTDTGAITDTPAVFVRNKLEIATPAGNPGKVTGLADFAKQDLKIALCAEQVPCGAAARKVFQIAGITPAPDTLEQDVKAVLTKVSLGEVDAALVYRTDVKAAGDKVAGMPFAEADQAVNDYPIAACAKAPNSAGAKAFVDYVRSDKGTAVLTQAGFAAP